MHILHLYKDYYPVIGGIENHIKLLAEAQAARGHQVTVLVTSRDHRSSEQVLNHVRVIRAGRLLSAASTPLSIQLFTLLARERPDITHLHFPYPPGETAQLLMGKSTHTVMTYHSDIVRQVRLLKLYKPLMSRVLNKTERIIVSSQAYLASSPVLPRYRAKCTVIPLGIDQKPFREYDQTRADAIHRQYGSRPLVLYVGVLRYYKGLPYLIEAMQDVDANLVIVGEGPMSATLRQMVFRLGLASRVFFIGQVSNQELPAYYHAADCFVLPASERSEAFGLVLVEALASGLPIISTELGTATSYVNLHDESGLVVPPRNAAALAEALNRLLFDDALRARLARGALRRAALFEAQRMVAQVEDVYQSLLEAR